MDGNFGCTGMADDIREGLLKNAKEGGAEILFEGPVAQCGVHIAADAGFVLKLIGLPFQCGSQAQVVEHAWPQLGRDATDGLNCGIDVGQKGFGFFDELLLLAREPAGEPG